MIKLIRIDKKDLDMERSYWVKEAGMILTGRQLSVMFSGSEKLTVFPFEKVEEKFDGLQDGQGTDGSYGIDSDVFEGRE
jgi:prenyltransferase beta subunit